jgi:hypothetical protein
MRCGDTSSDWSAPTTTDVEPTPAFRVDVRHDDHGWTVVIVDGGGVERSRRACADETEAWTYASTVRQHLYWLSEDRFRDYYRLDGTGES